MNKLNSKNKIILFVALFFVYIFFILYFFVFRSITEIKTTRANILNQKINLEKNIIRDKNMSMLARQLEEITPKIEQIDQIFINSSRELEFITTLEGLANKNKIQQKIILTTKNPEKNILYKKIPLRLSVQGTFVDIMNYLTDIESLKYYLAIKSLMLSGNKQNTRTNPGSIVNLEITAETFWK
ncbi:MAG: type 4a pilus biogenesis protein PilO [Patescibacteria group bacterium]|nr:type 4a pilus biogenesis protein PilO [Patescibacteria group bacterium]